MQPVLIEKPENELNRILQLKRVFRDITDLSWDARTLDYRKPNDNSEMFYLSFSEPTVDIKWLKYSKLEDGKKVYVQSLCMLFEVFKNEQYFYFIEFETHPMNTAPSTLCFFRLDYAKATDNEIKSILECLRRNKARRDWSKTGDKGKEFSGGVSENFGFRKVTRYMDSDKNLIDDDKLKDKIEQFVT